MRMFPICTIDFSETSRTNFFNIIKLIILIVFNMFFSDSFFNPINPFIFIVSDLYFDIILFWCRDKFFFLKKKKVKIRVLKLIIQSRERAASYLGYNGNYILRKLKSLL